MKQEVYDKIVAYILENQERFYRLAYSYVKNREDALDAVQNAVCQALEHCRAIRNEEAVRTWFYRILVNESLRILKERNRFSPENEEMPEIPYEEKGFEPEGDLEAYLGRLDGDTQTIIRLRFFEELSLAEIAQITKLNLNTVKARLYRGAQTASDRHSGGGFMNSMEEAKKRYDAVPIPSELSSGFRGRLKGRRQGEGGSGCCTGACGAAPLRPLRQCWYLPRRSILIRHLPRAQEACLSSGRWPGC